MKEKKNKSYHRIDDSIIKAYIKLASGKNYKEISVTELCKEAKINRTTFYRHFHGTWEIFEVISNGVLNKIREIFKDFDYVTFINNPDRILDEINKEIESKYDYYYSLTRIKGARYFVDKIRDTLKECVLFSSNLEPRLQNNTKILVGSVYFFGGIINLYLEWFTGQIKCSLKDINEAIKLSAKSYSNIFLLR